MNSLSSKMGRIDQLIRDEEDYQELIVQVEGELCKAINYPLFTGRCRVADRVLLNTTAVELSLGTGGYHYVIHIDDAEKLKLKGEGHIMKLRYTPLQFKTFSIEEESGTYHQRIRDFQSLNGFPVAVGTLHSQVSVFFELYKHLNPKGNTVYIMTDGGCLPLALSQNIKKLKKNRIIDYTITVGNSFGGDFEAVNIYSAIIMAREVLSAKAVLVAMGPGITGTATKYGFSGIEQGHILDAVQSLGGQPVALARISFSDKRERHFGLSHHSRTILSEIVRSTCIVPYSIIDEDRQSIFERQIMESDLIRKHRFVNLKNKDYRHIVPSFCVQPRSMGRVYAQEDALFDSSMAAAEYIWRCGIDEE